MIVSIKTSNNLFKFFSQASIMPTKKNDPKSPSAGASPNQNNSSSDIGKTSFIKAKNIKFLFCFF